MPATIHKPMAKPGTAAGTRAPLTKAALVERMRKMVKPEGVERWLHVPNRKLRGMTPMEVVESGETELLESILYHMESGEPE